MDCAITAMKQSNLERNEKQTLASFSLVNRLHTDFLEEKYGLIDVEVLQHDNKLRIAHLRDQTGISRTFAVTVFPQNGCTDSLAKIDQQIRCGAAIGKAFRQQGYEIRKNVLEVFITRIPAQLQIAFDVCTDRAKARISEFLARHGEGPVELYGTVIEIYHPDFRPPQINAVDRLQEGLTVSSLAHTGLSRDEIWNGIGSNCQNSYENPHYRSIRQMSCQEVCLIKGQLSTLLKKIEHY